MPRVGYVLDGKYHKGKPDLSKMQAVQQSTWKEWDHDKQRIDHAADIIQPYKGRKPNQEFIDLYPKAAIDYGFVKPEDNAS